MLLVASARLPHLGQDDQLCAGSLPAGLPSTTRCSAPAPARRRSRALRHLPLDPAAPIALTVVGISTTNVGPATLVLRGALRPTSTRSTNTFPHALLPHCSNRSVIPQQFGRFPVPESVSVSGGRMFQHVLRGAWAPLPRLLLVPGVHLGPGRRSPPSRRNCKQSQRRAQLRAEFDSIRDSYGARLAALEARLESRPAEPAPAAGVAPVPAVPPPVPETPAAPVAPAAAGQPAPVPAPRPRPCRRCRSGGTSGKLARLRQCQCDVEDLQPRHRRHRQLHRRGGSQRDRAPPACSSMKPSSVSRRSSIPMRAPTSSSPPRLKAWRSRKGSDLLEPRAAC